MDDDKHREHSYKNGIHQPIYNRSEIESSDEWYCDIANGDFSKTSILFFSDCIENVSNCSFTM